jgi:hypothetical protein
MRLGGATLINSSRQPSRLRPPDQVTVAVLLSLTFLTCALRAPAPTELCRRQHAVQGNITKVSFPGLDCHCHCRVLWKLAPEPRTRDCYCCTRQRMCTAVCSTVQQQLESVSMSKAYKGLLAIRVPSLCADTCSLKPGCCQASPNADFSSVAGALNPTVLPPRMCIFLLSFSCSSTAAEMYKRLCSYLPAYPHVWHAYA